MRTYLSLKDDDVLIKATIQIHPLSYLFLDLHTDKISELLSIYTEIENIAI